MPVQPPVSLGRPVRQDHGLVEAPIDAVFAAGLRLIPGGGNYRTVDRERRLIVLQGAWWYRGETTFTPDDRGTKVQYAVYNVAEVARWASPGRVLQLRLTGALRRTLPELLTALSAELHCPARRLS
jgi:hypothetical protein